MRGDAIAAGFAMFFLLGAADASAIANKSAISLDLAKKLAAGCEAKAKQEGWRMNIAIVDDGANLVYFERMDGAFLGSVEVSQMKAKTSAKFPFPTRGWGEYAYGKDGKPGVEPGLAFFPGVTGVAGGLPIFTGAKAHIGAIGVSGGSSDQDEACAKAALDSAADDLK